MLSEDDKPLNIDEINWNLIINSVAGFCLVRRYELSKLHLMTTRERIIYLLDEGYLPEVQNEAQKNKIIYDFKDDELFQFMMERDRIIREILKKYGGLEKNEMT
jgi:hypothetical protein